MARSPVPPDHGIAQRLRRVALSDMPDVVFAAPPKSGGIQIRCPCGRSYSPPWHKKLAYEIAPDRAPGGSLSMPTVVPLPCPFCEGFNFLHLPKAGPQQGVAEFYGDEAILQAGGRPEHSIVYAFVAIHPERLAAISDRMADAKRRIRPQVPPSDWPFHTRDVRRPEWREEHQVPLSPEETNDVLRGLASALAERPDGRLVSASLFPPLNLDGIIAKGHKRSAVENQIRDDTLAAAMIGLTVPPAVCETPSCSLCGESRG